MQLLLKGLFPEKQEMSKGISKQNQNPIISEREVASSYHVPGYEVPPTPSQNWMQVLQQQ